MGVDLIIRLINVHLLVLEHPSHVLLRIFYPMHYPLPYNGMYRLYAVPKRAFTLIELLTVIAIIGVLTAITIPVVSSVRASAKTAQCQSNLRQLGIGVLSFAADNRGRLPGMGRPEGATGDASWMDVVNSLILGDKTSTVVDKGNLLQRMGDTPEPGKIYCPSMEPYGTSTRWPRAYVMNSFAINQSDAQNPKIASWNGINDYRQGRLMNEFSNPSRKLLIFESERNGDLASPVAPFDTIVLGSDAINPPHTGNGGVYAFRHKLKMHAVFMDGRVGMFDVNSAGALNNYASFQTN